MQSHRIVIRPFADKGFLHILVLRMTSPPQRLDLRLDFVMVVMTSQVGGVGYHCLPAQSWKSSTGTGPGTLRHLQKMKVSIFKLIEQSKHDD